MSPLPFLISRKAVSDLEEIWQYSAAKWSVDQANRYYTLLIDEINYICKDPFSGKPMDHIRQGYRASKVKSHLIFYIVQKDFIEIIRILHERMDIDSRLPD